MALELLFETRLHGERVRVFRDAERDKLVTFCDGVPRVAALESGKATPLSEALENFTASLNEMNEAAKGAGMPDAQRIELLSNLTSLATKGRMR
jgi:hypothetical protein